MQLQFSKTTLPFLQCIKSGVETQEETQELRMPEDMPDVGRILGAWGQILLRSKEWREDEIAISGGVMVWVLYMPEGEERMPQTVESWIPFQMKWNLPGTFRDGRIRISPLLRSVDARSTSARRMMVRATVSLGAEAYVQQEKDYPQLTDLPEDIYLRKRTYPLVLPREAGEKTCIMEEELNLPSSCPKIKQLLRFSLQPELIDRKVLSGKVVFRGAVLLHILYLDPADRLQSWEFEVPYSQYAELDTQYEQSAQTTVIPMITSLELDAETEDRLRLKANLTGQYVIYDQTLVEVAQDGYSNRRTIQLEKEMLTLPAVLDQLQQTVCAEQSLPGVSGNVVDVSFYPQKPEFQPRETLHIGLSGVFQVLYYDEYGCLQTSTGKWSSEVDIPAEKNVQPELTVLPSGVPKAEQKGGEICTRGDLLLCGVFLSTEELPVIESLEVGEVQKPDPNRPSLILRRMGSGTLWDVAKECGSTEEAIRQANQLDKDPDTEQMLLIPIP